MSYYYVDHFAKYIKPGAKRIGFSRFGDDFEMTAAKNPDGKLIAVFLNRKTEDTGFAIRLNGNVIRIQLPAQTISTVIID
jgi:glucosylceramidase